MRMDPREAFELAGVTGEKVRPTNLPTDLNTLSKMQNAHAASGLQDAFELFARREFPDLDLARDNGGRYLYREASDRFKVFVAGTFCG